MLKDIIEALSGMNSKMLVKALKHCAKHNCEGCPFNSPRNFTDDCIDREEVLLIAADLIEALQIQLADKEVRNETD